MQKSTIVLLLLLFITPLFSKAQSSWLTNNFTSYLSDNRIDEYINESNSIIDDLNGSDREKAECVLSLFEMLADRHTNLPAQEFLVAINAVRVSFSTKKISNTLSILSCSFGSHTSYILRNTSKKYAYTAHLKATKRDGTSYSTSTIKRGIGDNEYVDLNWSEEKYEYQLIKLDERESYW